MLRYLKPNQSWASHFEEGEYCLIFEEDEDGFLVNHRYGGARKYSRSRTLEMGTIHEVSAEERQQVSVYAEQQEVLRVQILELKNQLEILRRQRSQAPEYIALLAGLPEAAALKEQITLHGQQLLTNLKTQIQNSAQALNRLTRTQQETSNAHLNELCTLLAHARACGMLPFDGWPTADWTEEQLRQRAACTQATKAAQTS